MNACPSAVPDTTGLLLEALLPLGPPNTVPGEARLLGGCVGVYPNLGRLMRRRPAPLCSSLNLRCVVRQLSHHDVSLCEETHIEAEFLHCII